MRTSTTWKAGQSGNPRGRPRSLSSRKALRDALQAPLPDGSTTMATWAAQMIQQAVTLEDRLSVLKFLDGASPTPAEIAVEVAGPRIEIPSVDVRFIAPPPRPDATDAELAERARRIVEDATR